MGEEKILHILVSLYGEERGRAVQQRLVQLLEAFTRQQGLSPRVVLDRPLENDAILITYPNQVQEVGKPSLRSLTEFCEERLKGLVSGVHLLPFYPSSSDDGFSVIDYRQVDPAFGTWDEIARLGKSFRLMFDAVINHVSAQSAWFKGFLAGDPRYRDYFIVVEGDVDLSQVVRPRALPLLTRFETAMGSRQVWTTFSADQIDLNYRNPEVLLEVIDLLLFYIARGADFIRLDAIAYLWKEIGSSCIHLPQTHQIVQLFRAVVEAVAPHVRLITETNVPHLENISYFGDGSNEAHMVYNFALPPLILHTFRIRDAQTLSEWAMSLELPSQQVTFFNFLASHDGIGLNPARGILQEAEIEAILEQACRYGGLLSYKLNPDGSQSPYELNMNYFDAIAAMIGEADLSTQVEGFITSQAIMLAMRGVPGIYFHSLFGARGWQEGVRLSGTARAVNRQKFQRHELEGQLADRSSLPAQVHQRYRRLLEARAAHPAFSPYAEQQVIFCGDALFALLRHSPEAGETVVCLHNVTPHPQTVALSTIPWRPSAQFTDLIGDRKIEAGRGQELRLAPFQSLWLGVSTSKS